MKYVVSASIFVHHLLCAQFYKSQNMSIFIFCMCICAPWTWTNTYNEAGTKWPPIWRRHFRMHFRESELFHIDSTSTAIYSYGSNKQSVTISRWIICRQSHFCNYLVVVAIFWLSARVTSHYDIYHSLAFTDTRQCHNALAFVIIINIWLTDNSTVQ